MKKRQDSNTPPKDPSSDGQNTSKLCSNPVKPYRSVVVNFLDDHVFKLQVGVHAKLFMWYAMCQTDMLLGIGKAPIKELAAQANVDLSQFRVALQELENAELAFYDPETETLWLPRFFEASKPPATPSKFSRHLCKFESLPWSEVKQEAGRELIKLAKSWGPEYEVFNVIIRTAIRKPRKAQTRLRKPKPVLRLVKTNDHQEQSND